MDTGSESAAERVSEQLIATRRDYFAALLVAADYLAARAEHDPVARDLVEEVERARSAMVAGTLLTRCEWEI